MVVEINGKQRSHVPDYLLSTVDGSFVVVDVKPSRRLDDPAVRLTFDWAREIAADCSWGFEVFSEPDPVLLGNVCRLPAWVVVRPGPCCRSRPCGCRRDGHWRGRAGIGVRSLTVRFARSWSAVLVQVNGWQRAFQPSMKVRILVARSRALVKVPRWMVSRSMRENQTSTRFIRDAAVVV